jgi:hypothetical protein
MVAAIRAHGFQNRWDARPTGRGANGHRLLYTMAAICQENGSGTGACETVVSVDKSNAGGRTVDLLGSRQTHEIPD